MRQRIARAAGLALALVVLAPTHATAFAETHTETIVAEQRTSIQLPITQDAARTLLPAGWAPTDTPSLGLIFMDRKLSLGPDGKQLGAGINRLLVMSLAGRNTATGETRSLIVGGYSTDPAGYPGAYKVYGQGVVELVRTETLGALDANSVREQWTVKAADGGVLEVNLAFARGVPVSSRFELKVHSGSDPDFYRIYRGQQATDVVRNASGVDRVQAVSVKASGGRLGEILAGSGAVTSVSNSPFYMRDTYLP